LSGAELDIEINFYSLEHFCEELFEENFLFEVEPDLVKKPSVMTPEDRKFWQIHKVQKKK